MFTVFRLSMNACRECLREPVYYLMLLAALIMIGLFPYFSMFVFRQQIRLVCDSSMATTMLFGLFAAVLCSARTISREMKNGTVLLLMSKPVSRFSFVISKICGILVSLTIFVFICNAATWLSILIAVDQFRLSEPLVWCYFGAICAAALYGGIRNFIAQKSFSSNAVAAMTLLFPVIPVPPATALAAAPAATPLTLVAALAAPVILVPSTASPPYAAVLAQVLRRHPFQA